MTLETGILFSLLGTAISVAAFYIGRLAAAKNEGAFSATLQADIRYLQRDIESVLEKLDKMDTSHSDSIRRLHERIDRHLREDHGFTVQNRGE